MNYTEMEAKVVLFTLLASRLYLINPIGPRGNEQRALGSIIIADAGDREWHLQLVRANNATASKPLSY